MSTLTPRDATDTLEVVAGALARQQRLEIVGGGRCRDYGRPVRADAVLDLSALSGVATYEPAELVMSVAVGTPLTEVNALLRENRQHLAFEPPDLGPLWGRPAGGGTIGGCLMLGLAGPRRIAVGAPRDHFLGFKGINGHAQSFGAGGRVVKNVTGFDLPKLFAGSLGTLGILTQVTLKTLPRAELTLTLAVPGLALAQAVALLQRAAGSPAQITGGAHLPPRIVSRSGCAVVKAADRGLTVLRLEGFPPSVEWCAAHLSRLAAEFSREPVVRLEGEDSATVWQEIGAASYFTEPSLSPLWRLSVEPAHAAQIAAALESQTSGDCLVDHCGGLLWLAIPQDFAADAGAQVVRGVLAKIERPGKPTQACGHATLLRAAAGIREQVAPFQPLEPGLAALTRRLKQQFDPHGLFNPARQYPDL